VDDDNSGKLSVDEFKKVLKDYRLKFTDKEAETLFKTFDRDGSGEIDYDEFLRQAIVINAL
jgi:Ca2+-binding EF-hand superfamily protein